ncbi:hypothetical protein QF034_000134 [Streptomyces africanus]|uniref:Uncharacterized protein n=1 Tax=Streptomyces africanus TaxID=231024 RepID=A0ABU0QEU5_9ACTN|nr:hypothetical protein [Streptomyces africanus]
MHPESKYAVRVSRRGWAPPRGLEWAQGAAYEVGHGLPVAGEDRVEQQVGRAHHRLLQLQAVRQVEGVEGLLVGVDDPAGAGMDAAEGDPATVGGHVCLLGEEREHVVLVAGQPVCRRGAQGRRRRPAIRTTAPVAVTMRPKTTIEDRGPRGRT